MFPVLLALSALAAAVFGALHNQLSFSVGPDYFYAIKFPQFGIVNLPDRLGAALVGVQASWWMGVLVGAPAFLYGLIAVARPAAYFAAGLSSIGFVVMIALGFAGLGLLAGMLFADQPIMDRIATPEGANRAEVLRAGLMHDASYIGGALGAIAAFLPMRLAARANGMPHAA